MVEIGNIELDDTVLMWFALFWVVTVACLWFGPDMFNLPTFDLYTQIGCTILSIPIIYGLLWAFHNK